MPVSFRVDFAVRCLRIDLEGDTTDMELLEAVRRLRRRSATRPLNVFVDASGITRARVTAVVVRDLARKWPRTSGSRTALFAPSEAAFGLLRMYEIYANHPNCRAFRDREEALAWIAAPRALRKRRGAKLAG